MKDTDKAELTRLARLATGTADRDSDDFWEQVESLLENEEPEVKPRRERD